MASNTGSSDDVWSSDDSCQKVRRSCREWMAHPEQKRIVQIPTLALKGLARDIHGSRATGPSSIEWDEEQWHYRPSDQWSPRIATERLALYILALDAINFCFWPNHSTNDDCINLEYQHLAMAMAGMARRDEEDATLSYIFAPSRLAGLSVAEMTRLWDEHLAGLDTPRPIAALADLPVRCRLWNEVGRVLVDRWNGSILQFLEWNDGSSRLTAPQLVDRIVDNFPGFRDFVPLEGGGGALYLYKRAQICVGDWNASLGLNLGNLDRVTTFADYRVPQLLRHFGVLQYGSALASTIDQGGEVLAGSREEMTIRAATVVAVEDLVQELHWL